MCFKEKTIRQYPFIYRLCVLKLSNSVAYVHPCCVNELDTGHHRVYKNILLCQYSTYILTCYYYYIDQAIVLPCTWLGFHTVPQNRNGCIVPVSICRMRRATELNQIILFILPIPAAAVATRCKLRRL